MADIQFSRNITYKQTTLQSLIDQALEQEEQYFYTLLEGGYILDNKNNVSYDLEFTPRRLKQGLARFLSNKYGGQLSDLNTTNIDMDKINHFQQVLVDDIQKSLLSNQNKDELILAVQKIIQASANELQQGQTATSVGFLRELMTLDIIIKAAHDINHQIINVSSSSRSWSEGLHYDFQVELAADHPTTKTGTFYNSGILRGEVKSRLDQFKITGFDIQTLMKAEYAAIDKALQDEMTYINFNSGDFHSPGYFNKQLSFAVLKWKLAGYFPFYFKIGERGGSRDILLCSEMLQSLTTGAHLIGTATFSQNQWYSRLQFLDNQDWEFYNISTNDLQKANKKARDLIRKRLLRYDLQYHK